MAESLHQRPGDHLVRAYAMARAVGRPAGISTCRAHFQRRRESLKRAPVHQTQHHHPRTRVGGAAPPGGRRRAIRRLYSVRNPPWVVGAGSGRVPGPKFAAGTAAGAAGGFLAHREGQKSVWFCPLSGAHQSAWSLYIMLGHIPRRRRPAGA
jgi:hypothetical protein